MYPWQKHFPDYRVPRAVLDLVDAKLFVDGTFRGSLPHFSTRFPDGSVLTIWVEHPSTEHRLYESERYALSLDEPGTDVQTVLKTNNAQEVLDGVRRVFEEKGGPRPLEDS